MIWGLTLEPGKDYTQLVNDEVQLSMATMESRGCIGSKDEKYSHVMLKTSTAEYMLCTLVSGITFQQGLDLKLMPNDEVTFSVHGTNRVYLTGYSYMSMDTNDEQQEAWIEESSIDDPLPLGSKELVSDEEAHHPLLDQDMSLPGEAGTNDEEEYTVSLYPSVEQQHPEQHQPHDDVPASGQLHKHSSGAVDVTIKTEPEVRQPPPDQPLAGGHEDVRAGPSDLPSTSSGVLSLRIKSETHPVAEIDHQPSNQPVLEERERVRGQVPNLPSTSAGKPSRQSLTSLHPNTYSDIGTGVGTRAAHRQPPTTVSHTVTPDPACMTNIHHWNNNNTASSRHAGGNYFGDIQSTVQYSGNTPNMNAVKGGLSSSSAICPPGSVNMTVTAVRRNSYRCSFCSSSFCSPGPRAQHERTHVDDLPFSCKHCPKVFRKHDSLKKHLRTHTGERPYTCDLCGKTFIQNSHLHVHLRKHHNKVTWKTKT